MIFKNNATVLNKLSVSYLMVVLIGSFLTGVTADIILENFSTGKLLIITVLW